MGQKSIIALLSAFLAAGIVLLIEGTPEQQARRDVARCTEVARMMMARLYQRPPQSFNDQELHGYTLTCLMGKH